MPVEQGSQHYIKRLVGVPDDRLEVRDRQLFVNEKRATEAGMVKVMDKYPQSHPATHSGYGGAHRFDLTGKREYVAMGDNSSNSADSRTWGTVPEVNVVGPAFVVYWPFKHHWGRIR